MGETRAVYLQWLLCVSLHTRTAVRHGEDCWKLKSNCHPRSSFEKKTGGNFPPILTGKRKRCFNFTGFSLKRWNNHMETIQDKTVKPSKRKTKTVLVVIKFIGFTVGNEKNSSPVFGVNYIVCFPPRWLNTHSVGHQKQGNRYLPKMLSAAKCSWTIGKKIYKPSSKKQQMPDQKSNGYRWTLTVMS